jgi:hypothetical protein
MRNFPQACLWRQYQLTLDTPIHSGTINGVRSRVLEKCGFKLENIVKGAYIKFKQKEDKLNYRILKAEFENLQKQDFSRESRNSDYNRRN